MTGPAALVARTCRIDADIDLLTLAGDSGVLFERGPEGFAGRGVALRAPVTEIARALDRIEVDDEVAKPGTGPVAFGALPFRPDGPEGDRHQQMIVPALCVGRGADGTRWLTTVTPTGTTDADEHALLDEAMAGAGAGAVVPPGPSSFEITASLDPSVWCDRVADAVARIRTGALDKVVLARQLAITADEPIVTTEILRRFRAAYPGCFIVSVDGFVAATPELLVSRHDDVVRSQPMAGTAPRRGDPQADARLAANLLASATYRHEHQVTIEGVHDTLVRFSSYVDYEAEPSVVALANVQHLATTVQGRLSHPPASVLELREALHPTPAVCGRPTEVARAVIAELEGFDRGRYAGSVGWVDRHGNGQWAVSLRCAQLNGRHARVWAGNGMVDGSDPVTELAETRAKFQAVLSALIRP